MTELVLVAATIASSLTLTIDDGFVYVETNDPDVVVLHDDRPLPLNMLVCLSDPPRDDGPWLPLKRLA